MAHTADHLIRRFGARDARTVVVGLGYVGLPLAVLHAQAGFACTGVERYEHRVDGVRRAESYIEEVSDAELASAVRTGRLTATADFDAISSADVVSICVPTPLDSERNPDVGFIRHVLERGRPFFRAGQLILLESTTYPGTTEEVLVPFFEGLGLRPGRDVFVAFAPERIDPGNRTHTLRHIPRVVGGVTRRCGEVASAFYRCLVEAEVRAVSSPTVAELAKMIENVFRVVNVSLVNELAQMADAMRVDLWEAIDAAATKPFGYMPFFPGPGVGGHCIPVDPFYLSWKARQHGFDARFIALAGAVNDHQPEYVTERIAALLGRTGLSLRGARVLLLGMAFKRNVADTRESPALRVARLLLARGAEVVFHDPHVPAVRLDEGELLSCELTDGLLRSQDIVVVTTDHDAVDYARVARLARLVYDTRNATPRGHGHVYRLGAPT